MIENEELLSTKQVAERLGLTVTTIYQYVKNKKLKPVYDDWKVDETMLFYLSDVQRLENQRPSGYTTAEVANELGVHQTTIAKQIKEGKIKADKVRYRGRMTYFVPDDVLEDLKQTYASERRDKGLFYQKAWNYYLFQSFINEQTKEFARVEKVTKDSGYIVSDSGEQIEFVKLKEKGFYPVEQFTTVKTINKPGYVQFRFEKPNSLHSPIYEIIETFYRTCGHKNIKVYQEDNFIHIKIKPLLLKLNDDSIFSILFEHIIEGKVTERHNGILLDSCQERLMIYVSTEQKRKLKQEAKLNKLTVEELVLSIIENYHTS